MLNSAILIVIAIVIACSGQVLLKTGMGQVGTFVAGQYDQATAFVLHALYNRYIVAGIALYALGAIVWMIVLSRVKLSVAYPMLALNYVLIMLCSRYIFGEEISSSQWLGAGFICIGVSLVARG